MIVKLLIIKIKVPVIKAISANPTGIPISVFIFYIYSLVFNY
jgi:hypothetical protein